MSSEGSTQTIEELDEAIYLEEQADVETKRQAAREVIRIIRASDATTVGEAAALLLDLVGDAFYGIYTDLTHEFWDQDEPAAEAIGFLRCDYLS